MPFAVASPAIARALEAQGYEVNLGGLHEYRAGRPSLSCDVIEPLRVPTVDRWVVATCGQGELAPSHFVREESGGFRLQPTAFGKTLYLWEAAWAEGKFDLTLRKVINDLATFLRERQATSEESLSEDDL